MVPRLTSLMPTRLLTTLSAAVAVAGMTPALVAGPSDDIAATPSVDSAPASAATLPSTRRLIGSSAHRGFALDLFSTSALTLHAQAFDAAPIGSPSGSALADVSDFMPATWLRWDDALDAPASVGGERLDGSPAMAQGASPDVQVLSVPQIPLPPAVLPAFAGLAFTLYLHRRAARRRRLLR